MNTDKAGTQKSVAFLYDTVFGRCLLKIIQKLRLDIPASAFLRSGASKVIISSYIKRNNIDMTSFEGQKFRSFQEFFSRRKDISVSGEVNSLISPCDGWLSVYRLGEDSVFNIKNSHYSLRDFLNDSELASAYKNGLCLVFRLCPSDYHRYCYIDDGIQSENHYIEGMLHSVQPVVHDRYPVFVLNRRSWCLLNTEHFGPVVQTEIGALIVGGIVNNKSSGSFRRGEEKGYFELSGSTIVLLFRSGTVCLPEETEKTIDTGIEHKVSEGMRIGSSVIFSSTIDI